MDPNQGPYFLQVDFFIMFSVFLLYYKNRGKIINTQIYSSEL